MLGDAMLEVFVFEAFEQQGFRRRGSACVQNPIAEVS